MKKSSLIGHAAEAFQLIHSRATPADSALNQFFRSRHYLGSKDRRFISETLYPMLRHARVLEFYIEKATPHVPTTSSGGSPFHPLLFYVAYASKVLLQPSQVIIDDLSDLWKKNLPDLNLLTITSNFVMMNPPEFTIDDIVRRFAIMYSMPDFAVREWMRKFGEVEGESLCSALNTEAPLAIRVNRLKGTVDECRRALASEGVRVTDGRVSPEGLILEKRVAIQSLRSFQEGWFEMQDEGSQLISFLVSPNPGETIVDACAGGGGKSLHMATLMKNSGIIHAIDIDSRRLNAAVQRSLRVGMNILDPILAQGSVPLQGLTQPADRILVDAPCSGTGAFRRNPWAKLFLSAEQVAGYCEVQRNLLQQYAPLVRPGGRLVYATCSLLSQENEAVVSWFLEHNSDFRLLDAMAILHEQGIDLAGESHFLTVYPHRHNTDGFFAAAMKRSA